MYAVSHVCYVGNISYNTSYDPAIWRHGSMQVNEQTAYKRVQAIFFFDIFPIFVKLPNKMQQPFLFTGS